MTPGDATVDAVILAVGDKSYGVELSLVCEVLRCGPITPVPSAPAEIVGAVNAGGQVLPVLDLGSLLGEVAAQPRPGDAALRVAVEELEAVVVLGRIVEVAALREPAAEQARPGRADGMSRPMSSGGGAVELIDLPIALEAVRRLVGEAVLAATVGGPPADDLSRVDAAVPKSGKTG